LPKDLDGLIAAAASEGRTPPLLAAIADFNRRLRDDAAVASGTSNGRTTYGARSSTERSRRAHGSGP
jgi:hypothetical protein